MRWKNKNPFRTTVKTDIYNVDSLRRKLSLPLLSFTLHNLTSSKALFLLSGVYPKESWVDIITIKERKEKDRVYDRSNFQEQVKTNISNADFLSKQVLMDCNYRSWDFSERIKLVAASVLLCSCTNWILSKHSEKATQEWYKLFWINPGSNALKNWGSTVTCLPSHKTFKKEEQDMLSTDGEVRTNP